MDGFNVETTSKTIYSISRTFEEASESAASQAKQTLKQYLVKEIKNDAGETKAYIVLENNNEVDYILKYKALSDNDIKIIDFDTENELRRKNNEYIKKLFDEYRKDEEDIKNGNADDRTRHLFSAAESWYKNLSFDKKCDKETLDMSSFNFKTLDGKKLSDEELKKFAYERFLAKKESRKKYLKNKDVILGEYDDDGNYNPDALFNVKIYNLEDNLLKMKELAIKENFQIKTYSGRTWLEKDNATADDVRYYMKKNPNLEYVPMQYARSDDYRKKYFEKIEPKRVYIDFTKYDLSRVKYSKEFKEDLVQGRKIKYVEMYRCAYCGYLFEKKDIEVDHVIPVKAFKDEKIRQLQKEKGIESPNDLDNLVFACKECNQKKGASVDPEWSKKARFGSKEWNWVRASDLSKHIKLALFIVAVYFIWYQLFGFPHAPAVEDDNVKVWRRIEIIESILLALQIPHLLLYSKIPKIVTYKRDVTELNINDKRRNSRKICILAVLSTFLYCDCGIFFTTNFILQIVFLIAILIVTKPKEEKCFNFEKLIRRIYSDEDERNRKYHEAQSLKWQKREEEERSRKKQWEEERKRKEHEEWLAEHERIFGKNNE